MAEEYSISSILNKTNAEMLALVNPVLNQRVFNTDWDIEYYFDGDVWLNSMLIKRINKDASAMAEGNPIFQDSLTDLGVLLSNSPGHIAIYGVVKDVYNGGVTDKFVTVALSGCHNVLCKGTVVRNQVIKQSNSNGVAISQGVGGVGIFGITTEERSGPGDSLIECLIQPTERY